MNILWLGLIAAIAVVFLIAHCYLYRGLRITLTFFISCFLYGILKENAIYYIEGVMSHSKPPYEILNPVILIFQAPLVVCIGWSFALYTSWWLAEGILKKIELFNGKLFPTLLLGGLIAAAVSYCVEATGIAAGWWRWTKSDIRLSSFFVGVPLSPLEGWFFTFLAVMAPYFLIECSKYRIKKWRYLFILPTFLYVAIRLNSNYMLAMIVECAAIIILFYLAFRSPLTLTTRICPFIPANKNEKRLGVFPCDKECQIRHFTFRYPSMPISLILKGNTVFFENQKIPDKTMEIGINRIVYQAVLPL